MSVSDTFTYIGHELDIFAFAHRWKAYWISNVRQWVRGDVLEVGAGLGSNTIPLQNNEVRSWQCLEPDPELASRLTKAVAAVPNCSVRVGTMASMAGRQFDSILYIDVLEHIELDRQELAEAANLLRPRGHIIVLSPAHPFLYSNFDATIGHKRRYTKRSLRNCTPTNCKLEVIFYLDSIGMFASMANRVMLRQSTPTVRQIKTWDNYIVPLSRVLDSLIGYTFGKTIVGIWTRTSRNQSAI
jgi:SAM-dependent methyltransferase